MEEVATLEMRGLGLLAPEPDCRFARIITMPKNGDSAAAAVEAATGRGLAKAASWSDFAFCFPDVAENKVEIKTKAAARVEEKTKTAARVEEKTKTAVRVEGKTKAARVDGKEASAGSIETAAKVEAKAASASCIEPEGKPEPAATVKGKGKSAARKPEPPEPKVVSVKTEKLSNDEIQWLLKNPIKRPTPPPESFFERYPHQRENLAAAYASIDKVIKVREDIEKQYFAKGYVIVGVEYFDNGQRRLFSLPEEATIV